MRQVKLPRYGQPAGLNPRLLAIGADIGPIMVRVMYWCQAVILSSMLDNVGPFALEILAPVVVWCQRLVVLIRPKPIACPASA